MVRIGWIVVGVCLLAGCGGFSGGSPNDKKAGTRVSRIGSATVISESDPNFRRFELPEAESECNTDEGCSSAGCSGEVCTTSKQASEIMTYCDETYPGEYFYCGCLETRCRWQKY